LFNPQIFIFLQTADDFDDNDDEDDNDDSVILSEIIVK